MPESQRCQSPEEDINGVDGHPGGAPRKERRQGPQEYRPEGDPIRKQLAGHEEYPNSSAKRQERGKKADAEYRLTKECRPGRDEPGDHRAFVEITNVRVPGPQPVVGLIADELQMRAVPEAEDRCQDEDRGRPARVSR